MFRNVGPKINFHQINFGLTKSFENVPDAGSSVDFIEEEVSRLSKRTQEPAKAFWYSAKSGSQDHMDVLIITGQKDIDAEEKRRDEVRRARDTYND
jgi:hypothetical protein